MEKYRIAGRLCSSEGYVFYELPTCPILFSLLVVELVSLHTEYL